MKNLIKVFSVVAFISMVGCNDQNINSKREGFAPFPEEERERSPEQMESYEKDYQSGFTKGNEIRPDGRYPVPEKGVVD